MPTLVIVRRPRTARSVTQTVRMRFLVGTPVRAMGVVGLGRVGWRLALPPLIELGGACRAPLRIKRPVDGLRIDRPPFGTRLLEVVLAQPRLLRHLGAFAIDLRLGQPPVGFERVPIAPLGDGPAQVNPLTP